MSKGVFQGTAAEHSNVATLASPRLPQTVHDDMPTLPEHRRLAIAARLRKRSFRAVVAAAQGPKFRLVAAVPLQPR